MTATVSFSMEMVIVGCAGLIVGGLIPTLVYRVPRHLSLVPLTACTTCSHVLGFFEEIPLVSWVALRGRCRHCHDHISIRYPLIELANVLLYLGLALRIGFHWQLPAYLVAASSLLTFACIDWEHHKLPREIVVPVTLTTLLLFVVAAWRYDDWHRLGVACLLALVVLVWFAVVRVTLHSLGFGDVLVAPLLGLVLGWINWQAVFIGVLVSCALALAGVVIAASIGRATLRSAVPLGPYLAAGTLAVTLVLAHGVTP